jgi:hypothetical protein
VKLEREGEVPAEPKLIGNREIGKSAGRETMRIASSNEFDYPPEAGGYEFKAG